MTPTPPNSPRPFIGCDVSEPPSAGHDLSPPVAGTIADYHALSRFHYRPHPPATITHILTIRAQREPIAILTISMPTLNGRWRNSAFPGLITSDRSSSAHRINRSLRTISRVIVDPRYRAQGLATRLVAEYLAKPLTPLTEAVAAMGVCCPFFATAGMIPHPLPPPPCDLRLTHAITLAGLRPLDLLRSPQSISFPISPWLVRELRRWADRSRATRPLRSVPTHILARRAAMTLIARPLVYIHIASTDAMAHSLNVKAPLPMRSSRARGPHVHSSKHPHHYRRVS